MGILKEAMNMLIEHPLCDSCLGRQFALLGYNMENKDRGKALKISLTLQASSLALAGKEGVKNLKILFTNGFSKEAKETLEHFKKTVSLEKVQKTCFLCEDRLKLLDSLTKKILQKATNYEYSTFLVGINLPVRIEEREDEFKAEFSVSNGESLRHEFGRLLGKRLAEETGKIVEYLKPDLTIVINPFAEQVRFQINPLFIAGRYNKLVRDIPQSKWFCSECHGKGCKKCNGTGKLYPDSVEELISKHLLLDSQGQKTSFHASGREDIDARMLGKGRPFVVEVSKPIKRFLDLKKLRKEINESAEGKVRVSYLHFSNRDAVRRLKKAESAQKKYRMEIIFEKPISEKKLQLLEKQLSGSCIKQQTPLRVLHRRADLTREKYIYKVKVKKLSLRRAEMEISCQGGLYVKELVFGDQGRTIPNVSEILGNKAKPLKLDVLNVVIEDNVGEL